MLTHNETYSVHAAQRTHVHTHALQAEKAESDRKHAELKERHALGKVEFEKLKAVSGERKKAVAQCKEQVRIPASHWGPYHGRLCSVLCVLCGAVYCVVLCVLCGGLVRVGLKNAQGGASRAQERDCAAPTPPPPSCIPALSLHRGEHCLALY